jgi:hypothetical protein
MRDRTAVNEAERCLRAAIDVARAQEAKWWELRATTSIARLLGRQSRSYEAVRCSPKSTAGSPKASTPPT